MDKINYILDGSPEEQTELLKEAFGLSEKQSFQDLDVSDLDENDN